MFGFGITEWILIFFIALLLFGPRWFVRSATSIGGSVKGFRKSLTEAQKEDTPRALPPGPEEERA